MDVRRWGETNAVSIGISAALFDPIFDLGEIPAPPTESLPLTISSSLPRRDDQRYKISFDRVER
jgi:hypothetical protein